MIGSTRYSAGMEIQRQTTLASEIAKLQTSVSTNQRLTAASDDPKAAARIADIRQLQSDNAIWLRNVDTGTAVAAAADKTLDNAATAMRRAKELIIAGGNDTNANVDRAKIAAEMRSLAVQITTLSQTRDPNGQPLFPKGTPLSIPVSSGVSLPATGSGDEIFGKVKTAQGDRSIADILTTAADALDLAADGKLPYTDADGNTTDADGNPLVMTRGEALKASLTAITDADDHVAAMQTAQGLRAARFDDIRTAINADGDNLKIERSSLEDTDLTYAVAAYQAKNLALTAAQTMFAQTRKNSLFDLIG